MSAVSEMPVLEWLRERKANCLRIASTARDADREGWLEDARYFAKAIDALQRAGSGKGEAIYGLLAALKAIVPGECPIVTHHKPDCVWCAATRAIAKAEGRA